MRKTIIFYGIAALLVTLLCGLIYTAVQQSHRSTANDPQLQIARDMKEGLANNQSPDHFMTGDTIDLSKSLAVFKVLYDNNGEPVQSTGMLDGKLPHIPKGVFDFTRKNKEDVLTWQPRKEVRVALVVESIPGKNIAFVAVGRSLAEVEKRISNLTLMVFTGWLACLGGILLHWLISFFGNRNKRIN